VIKLAAPAQGDKVYVSKLHNSYAAKGTVIDVCKDKGGLEEHFSEEHPFFMTYTSWVKNDKPVYIVELESNLGLAGFLKQELSTED
jgi:hypothetical protein